LSANCCEAERACTILLRATLRRTSVKELLGHESLETLSTTADLRKHYAKLTLFDLKKEHQRCHPREKDGCDQP
jgi:hypothetical protein